MCKVSEDRVELYPRLFILSLICFLTTIQNSYKGPYKGSNEVLCFTQLEHLRSRQLLLVCETI